MDSQKEYFAFISYKREDEKDAKWLWHKLEHYHLPINVRKENPSLPQSIRPVFKDTSELAAGVLADEINDALVNSKYLIVVCSPRAALSKWVNKEVQTFIDMGRSDKIIPFIIEGTSFSPIPEEECFPSALLKLPNEQELLGVNINDMGRDAAVVKVVAYMFGLKFDLLWQRFKREQKHKRILGLAGAVLIALIGLGVGAFFIKQNNRLTCLVTDLKETNNTYSQLNSDLKQYVFAGEMRGNGCDNAGLMHFAYHPYEPLVAFSDDWGCWLHYLNTNIEKLLPIDDEHGFGEVDRLCFSPDGKELMVMGFFGIYIWNVEKCELLGHYWHYDSTKFPDVDEDSLIEKRLSHLNSTISYKWTDGKLTIYNDNDRNEKNIICSTNLKEDEDSTLLCIPNPVFNEILFATQQRAALYDDTKKEFVLFFKGYKDLNSLGFDNTGELLRVDKSIFSRTIKIDTIQNLKYTTKPIEEYPFSPIKTKRYQYDETTNSSIEATDLSIIYRHGKMVKEIEVLRNYTTGNGQEYLSFNTPPVFAGPNKVVAIVEQGKHRIYNTTTWTLMGTLDNYVWDSMNQCFGHEWGLSHPESYIATAKYVDSKLYVVSSGGIVRIYNVNKPRLEALVELPRIEKDDEIVRCIEKCNISEDASKIYYSLVGQPFYYIYELPNFSNSHP